MAKDAINGFLESAHRGIRWLVSQQRPDGSFCDPSAGVGGYYKIPYALSLAGRTAEALRLATWIERHHATGHGDFRGAQRKALEPVHDRWPVYANAWLVQGLHRLGRWDLARRGAQFLLTHQVPAGGFYALDGNERILEPVGTAWGGLAVLTAGHLAAARRAGELLVRMVTSQPDPQRFYFRMTVAGDLVTETPAGSELDYFVDATRPRQIYYNPGIAMIFLAHLFRATREARYLEACRVILGFVQRCAADVFRFPPSGKLGAGCALLFELAADAGARRGALSVGEYLFDTQTAEGLWRLPDAGPYRNLTDRDGHEVHLDITAEFSIFLMEIAARLSDDPAAPHALVPRAHRDGSDHVIKR